jgi:type I restriction-modification system DNA methylase subunit
MSKEAMKLALGVLRPPYCDAPLEDVIKALEEALAKQEQGEPVGQLLEDAFGRGQVMWFNKPKDESMLYTTPQQRKPLTEDHIDEIASFYYPRFQGHQGFARAIESAHGIKE